eukprot:scaffold37951_cov66-Phaeocystis_antarctica.AAC.2
MVRVRVRARARVRAAHEPLGREVLEVGARVLRQVMGPLRGPVDVVQLCRQGGSTRDARGGAAASHTGLQPGCIGLQPGYLRLQPTCSSMRPPSEVRWRSSGRLARLLAP